jgi:hypothetical protein
MNEAPGPASNERAATNRTSPIGRMSIARRAFADHNAGFMKRLIVGLATTAVMSGGLGLAGLGLAGTAQADPDPYGYGPHQWCPGQPMSGASWPGDDVIWDLNVCHTYYRVGYGRGNVAVKWGAPSIWDGPNPPPPPPPPGVPPLWVP